MLITQPLCGENLTFGWSSDAPVHAPRRPYSFGDYRVRDFLSLCFSGNRLFLSDTLHLGMRERNEDGQYVETIDPESVLRAVREAYKVVTTEDVADSLGISQEAARQKLTSLCEQGEIHREDSVVWWSGPPWPRSLRRTRPHQNGNEGSDVPASRQSPQSWITSKRTTTLQKTNSKRLRGNPAATSISRTRIRYGTQRNLTS